MAYRGFLPTALTRSLTILTILTHVVTRRVASAPVAVAYTASSATTHRGIIITIVKSGIASAHVAIANTAPAAVLAPT